MDGERVDHGGDYDSLHEATLEEVSRLQRTGVRLRVFQDGPMLHMREVSIVFVKVEEWDVRDKMNIMHWFLPRVPFFQRTRLLRIHFLRLSEYFDAESGSR